MLISYRELGRWVDLSGIDDVDDLAHRMTMAGLEVEGVDHFGQGFDDIVVGRIDGIEEHENADRLVVCRVDAGDGERQIVCGATNMSEGDLVPVALPGSQPPALDFQIAEREVMGVESQGMLCSAEELGLADESEGLMILDPRLEVGTPIFEALGLVDTHFDIGLTPNRPDCLSHLGVAREVAAIYDAALDRSALDVEPAWERGAGAVEDAATLTVEDSEGCPRYVAAVLEDVRVGPSPTWLQRMVTAMGMRSINNVVDVTNVVLADVGQPLHAFDLDKLEGQSIIVRRAEAGESMVGIDHQEYELDASDLVIADAEKPVAIAGVMGGEQTEVTEETTRILLECAYFEPTTVRRTSKKLGLHTESSHRFERGIDPGATRTNAAYAIQLLLRTQEGLADPSVRSGVLEHHPSAWAAPVIEVPATLFRRILGTAIEDTDIARILAALEIAVEETEDGWRCTPPSFRPDLERPIDLVEEVARLWGYDQFDATLPDSKMGAAHERRPQQKHHDTIVPRSELRALEGIRIRLLAAGLHEAINYSFFSEEALARLGLPEDDPRANPSRVANPLSRDQALMRTTLVPGLLESLETNVAQRESDVALFEVGRTFHEDREALRLGIIATGATRRHFDEGRPWDFYDLKGLVESLAGEQAERGIWRRPKAPEPYLHPGVQAQWFVDGRWIGRIGQLHPELAADLGLEAPVLIGEIDMDALIEIEQSAERFRPFPKYPAVTRDFALLYSRDAEYAAIENAVHDLAERDDEFGAIFDRFRLFDVYEGEQVPEDQRSLAVEVVYRSTERTLTDDEVADADRRLLEWLEAETGAVLR
jgi:phenylalanyl-tRNA synthetase beta chain